MTRGELKSIIKECIIENMIDDINLTESEVEAIFESDIVLIENAFSDSLSAIKKAKKSYKENLSKAKECIRKSEFDDAKKFLDNGITEIKRIKKEIKNIESNSTNVEKVVISIISIILYLIPAALTIIMTVFVYKKSGEVLKNGGNKILNKVSNNLKITNISGPVGGMVDYEYTYSSNINKKELVIGSIVAYMIGMLDTTIKTAGMSYSLISTLKSLNNILDSMIKSRSFGALYTYCDKLIIVLKETGKEIGIKTK